LCDGLCDANDRKRRIRGRDRHEYVEDQDDNMGNGPKGKVWQIISTEGDLVNTSSVLMTKQGVWIGSYEHNKWYSAKLKDLRRSICSKGRIERQVKILAQYRS
jgi:hypothetical protein